MNTAKKALEIVNAIDSRYNQSGQIKQFTIDLIDHFGEVLNTFLMGESLNTEEDILGSLSYKASCAVEICDDELTDFYVLQELYYAINDDGV